MLICTLAIFLICAGCIVYFKVRPDNTYKAENKEPNLDDTNAYVNVDSNEEKNNNGNNDSAESSISNIQNNNSSSNNNSNEKTFTFTALGEIMMGGMDTSYAVPFKEVAEYTSVSDYTFTSLTTNVVDLEKIENPKSKYIVTKNILNAFTALGVDGVSIASDHMLDFGENIFKGTKSILKEADLDIMGVQDDIIYAEHDGIKLAFIAVTNDIIGSYGSFVEAKIWVYDNYMVKIKEAISKAKDAADTVILVTHLGSENKHIETDVMTWFYHELVNAGADLVLGNHALGVYPIEIYNGKPIIYSLGYFMHDTDYEIGKKAGIFNFTVDTDGSITSLEFIPTYIMDGNVKLYTEVDYDSAVEFMKYVAGSEEMELSGKGMIVKFKK